MRHLFQERLEFLASDLKDLSQQMTLYTNFCSLLLRYFCNIRKKKQVLYIQAYPNISLTLCGGCSVLLLGLKPKHINNPRIFVHIVTVVDQHASRPAPRGCRRALGPRGQEELPGAQAEGTHLLNSERLCTVNFRGVNPTNHPQF